tara:strand:+ start:596 stop:823 length:228 start_codon:yes stop_codon:yes gene_type:complete
MIDDETEYEWEGTVRLQIEAVYALRSTLKYCLETWPGSPARPAEEQEFLFTMIELMNRLALEHSFYILDPESDHE